MPLLICDEFLSTDELQFGFKRGMGCTEAIFALRTTIDHFTNNGSSVFMASLDIKKLLTVLYITNCSTLCYKRVFHPP